ncbi:hypothetical protein FKP32DRAFT_1636400 [Trametes sanguinea]|nr:hypothetical protein FKP32DRAFT_1636400 [Trametes sanguinea]
MQSQRFVEHEDHDMEWLAREAPQFHTHVEPQRLAPSYATSPEHCDDASSASSDDDSACSDSEDDAHNPYKFNNPSQKWVRDGDFVYAADDLQNSYLSIDRHASRDAPYVPESQEDKNKDNAAFLSSEPAHYEEPYIYRDVGTRNRPQTLSPLDLTPSLSPSPAPAHDSPESPRTRRATASSSRAAYSFDSEDEADTSSGDDASEDEYIPSPRISSRKLPTSSRRQSHGKVKGRGPTRFSYSPYPSSSTSTSTGESSSAAVSSRRPGSRNVQIIDQAPPPRGSWAKTGPDAYKCPYCDHVQKNRRSPDMERHIRSHFRRTGQAQWVCCGLPLEEAKMHGRGRNDNPWTFNGVLMVGGCHEDFSRMDALKRHWRNTNNNCIGDISYARVMDEPSQ